jgi:hypothetical protein
MLPNCYEPKFLADCMLGKLENTLKKLRRMGF